jgi:hypothetical protein
LLPYSQLTGAPAAGAAYPFYAAGNATTTLTQFNGGLTAFASSTIGNGTFGLTVSGNSTTTGTAYFTGNVGIGTTTTSGKLTVNASTAYTNDLSYALSLNGGTSPNKHLVLGYDESIDAGVIGAVSTGVAWKNIVLAPVSGNVGIGTTSPGWLLSLKAAVSTAQQAIAYDDSNYAQTLTSSVGDAFYYQSGKDALFNDSNLWVCAGGSSNTNGCAAGTPSGQGNAIVENRLGVNGTSTPFAAISVGANGSIVTSEKALTDTSTIAIDWLNGNQQQVTLGGNRTITFANYIPGSTLRLVLCQDATGSRTITWPNGTTLMWPAGTAPTLTAAANKCDVMTFLATNGTSTPKVLGSSVLNF